MTSRAGQKCWGFTLFEAAVAAGLLAIFVAVLVSRVVAYQAEAERVAAQQLVATLRTAMQVRAAKALIARGEQGLHPLVDENPIGWLSAKPANYLGEYYAPDREELPSGNWYFDRADRSLVYLLQNRKSFSLGTSTFLKFKVKLFHLPTSDRLDRLSKTSTGLVLDQVHDPNAVKNHQ
jgi:type II secretory pathway pseudopilin PulG